MKPKVYFYPGSRAPTIYERDGYVDCVPFSPQGIERRFARAFASYLIGRPEMRSPWSGQEWENPFAAKMESE